LRQKYKSPAGTRFRWKKKDHGDIHLYTVERKLRQIDNDHLLSNSVEGRLILEPLAWRATTGKRYGSRIDSLSEAFTRINNTSWLWLSIPRLSLGP
jgi:hypothetical protein